MKTSRCPALVLIALCGLLSPVTALATPSPPETVGIKAASADAASRVFETAQLHKDLRTLDRMLAPTYIFVHGSGKVGDRRDFLAAFSSPTEVFTAFGITNRSVLPVGRDGAIVAAEATVHGMRNGAPFTQHFRYDDTYVNAGGLWQVVYTQVTALNPT